MNKNRIRLTESQLHRVIKESVKNVLNEIGNTIDGQIALGALSARKKGIKGYNDGKVDDIGIMPQGKQISQKTQVG